MDKLKKIVGKRVIAILSCLMFLGSIFGTESKVDQYNGILRDGKIERVMASNSAKDNIAAIRVQKQTYMLSSSIINGYLIKEAIPYNVPDSNPLRGLGDEAHALYPDDFQPISVMDLLYMYNPGDGNSIISSLFQNDIDFARRNSNRKLMEEMIKIVVQDYAAGTIEEINYRIKSLVENGDPALGLEWSGIIGWTDGTDEIDSETIRIWDKRRQQRLNLLKNAIVDFLTRLRKYANDVSVIPNNAVEQNKFSHHLLDNKKMLTINSNSQKKPISYGNNGPFKLNASNNEGAIEELMLKMDANLLKEYNFKFSQEAISQLETYNAPEANLESIRDWIIDLCQIISSQWTENLKKSPAREYLRAITHTEQMVDWISDKYNEEILVKISGKVPCLKCSHYIQYATTVGGSSRKGDWNNRTVIGFKTGWNNANECQMYRYPTKVFNARSMDTSHIEHWMTVDGKRGTWVRQFILVNMGFRRDLGKYRAINNHTEEMWMYKDGIRGSNCYAIEDVEGVRNKEQTTTITVDKFNGQLQMQEDGSVIQIDRQILLPTPSVLKSVEI